jgi:hypothetical protein
VGELLVLRGHKDGVWAVVFSPDGRRIGSASYYHDRTVRLWDAETGRQLLVLRGHPTTISSLAFSPDGNRIASADSGSIRVWNVDTPAPDALVLHEALSLVRSRILRVRSEAELTDRIEADRTVNDHVRARAMELAHSFWQGRLRQEAEAVVHAAFGRLLIRSRVLESLRREPSLEPVLRDLAVELAASWPEGLTREAMKNHTMDIGARELNSTSWGVVAHPRGDPLAYRDALVLAEEACRITPEKSQSYPLYLNTLGLAQYRVGRHKEALATLTRSSLLNGGDEPADVAFLAMAQHQLGRRDAAQAALEKLRRACGAARRMTPRGAEAFEFLSEAEMLIDGHPSTLPDDVFAPTGPGR